MLEALYYGLATPQTATTKMYTDAYFTEWSTTMVNSSTSRSRRHSTPAASPQHEIEEPVVYRPRKRSSLPQMPPAPIIQPQRLPSVDIGISSWRLSFSAENRGHQLRKLSQEVHIPGVLNPEKIAGGPQSMRKWLHSQGLRPASQAVELSEDVSDIECSASHRQICTSSQDFGGVDGGGDSAATLHLHEMGISQRLASKGLQSSCSSPQLSSIGRPSHQRDVSSTSAISRTTYKSRVRRVQNTTDSLPLSERIPEAWMNVLENRETVHAGTSSFYPSANNSIQPSRKSSRFSLFSILPGSKSKTDLTELKLNSVLSLDQLRGIDPPSSTVMSPTGLQSPLSGCSIPIASASSESFSFPLAGYHRRPTIDTNSTAISETESFRQREAELIVVQTRFAAAEASRTPSTPRSSKFREEFDFTTTSKEEPLPSKPSAFSRLTRFAARSFDGPFERKAGIFMTPLTPAFEPAVSQHHPHSKHAKGPLSPIASPLEDASVLGMWGNAVKVHGEPRAKDVAKNLHIPGRKGHQDSRTRSSHDLRKKSHVSLDSKEKEKKKKFALKGLGWGMGDKESESDSEENPEDDWEAELAKVAQKAKGKSRNIVKKTTAPDRRYPASWSKFSSHDRHERTSSADAKDRIQVKDFATDGSEFLDSKKKTLREKIQKRLIAEYDKYATAEVQNNTEGTFGRRSSMRPAGDLEYPELEVLPLQNVSLMSHEQIAEHVEEVLKEEELERKEAELNDIFGPVKSGPPSKPDVQPGTAKHTSGKNTPSRSGTIKASGTGAILTETKPSASSSNTSAKKNPRTRRGPVARKPGEEAPKPKPPPKIAPPIIMPAQGRGAGKAIDLVDGSMDHGDEDSVAAHIGNSDVDDGTISIADPRFYEDCIVNTSPGPEMGLYCGESCGLDGLTGKGSRSSKYRTWSGRDWSNFRHSAKNRRSLGTLKLRKSTDEILNELKKAEVAEREKALKAAEEAWGGC
jgi:hypothetical protein